MEKDENYCVKCKKFLSEYSDIEWLGHLLIVSYTCPKCGCQQDHVYQTYFDSAQQTIIFN